MKYLIWKGIQAQLPDGGIEAKSRLFEDIKGLKCQVRCLDTPVVKKRDKKDIYPLSPPIAGQECHKCPAKISWYRWELQLVICEDKNSV